MMADPMRGERSLRAPGALFAAALLLPLVLVAIILDHARRTEQQRRQLAENVLRDYAAIAAWQIEARLRDGFHELVMASTRAVTHAEGEVAARPGPAALLSQDTTVCELAARARFAFRYDRATGALEVAGGPVSAASRAAAIRVARAVASPDSGSSEPHRIVFEHVDGESRAFAIFAPPSRGTSRPIYGLETGVQPYERTLARILENQHVLPPHLVKAPYNEDKLAVRLSDASGATLVARGDVRALRHQSSDTLPMFVGGLVLTVGLAPALAESLVVGGFPPSRMPAMLTLLALAVGLAAAALLQHRRARELDRARGRFVANVSHELRTPLTQISMFAETLMLERERSRGERVHFAGVIHREARRLASLVESVLRFSRGGAGPAPRLERTALADELARTVDQFAPMADAASSTVTLEASPGVHADVEPGALRQIVLNLLENAVKYGPEGQTITVTARRVGDDAVIAVEDEGPGIGEADRERVFEPFHRIESSRRVAGTGIGLTVVRDLARAMHGEARAERAPGGGARLVVRLPARPALEDDAAAPAEEVRA